MSPGKANCEEYVMLRLNYRSILYCNRIFSIMVP
jgi:hypothetical protein